MKVALYCRVSSDHQDTDLSISGQLKALKEYALRHGHEIVKIFVDEAESGRTAARPAFREMIGLAKTKNPPFQAILVWKLNRFARSRADSIAFKTLLRNRGIDVISINEPIDDSPVGHLLEGVIESIDEFYSENLGQDIKRGMRENAERGFFNGSRPPWGLRVVKVTDGKKLRNKLEPEPHDSVSVTTVRTMFDRAFHDMGCKEIAKTMNRDGFRTSRGQKWGRTTVYKILTNEAYKGALVWGGRREHSAIRSGEPPVRKENAWPAIIEPIIFDAVQQKLASKRPEVVHPRTVPSFYLLGGILDCYCGSAMTGHSAKSSTHFYYLCSRKHKQGDEACDARMLPKEKLERQVIAQLKARVLTDENMDKLVELVNDELISAHSGLQERIDSISDEMSDVDARLSRLYASLETGKLDLDDLAPRIKELKVRKEELSKLRVKVEAEMALEGAHKVDATIVKSYAKDLRGLLEESEIAERKAFLKSFIKKITVDHDKVMVSYSLPWWQRSESEPNQRSVSEPPRVVV